MSNDDDVRSARADTGDMCRFERRTLLRMALGTAIVSGGASALAEERVCQREPDLPLGRRDGDLTAYARSMAIGCWSDFAAISVPAQIDMVQSSGYETAGLGAARYAFDPEQRETEHARFRRRSANGRWFRIAEPAIGYTMAGAKGDGTGGVRDDRSIVPVGGADDTAAIQDLYDYLAARGGGIALVEPRQFNVVGITVAGSHIHTIGFGRESHVHTTGKTGRKAVFRAEGGGTTNRLKDIVWDNFRLSGGAQWGDTPFAFNDVLCGYGIQTRWVDDVRVSNCTIDHVSDSGISVRDGARPLVQGNVISHVAQGIDIFFACVDARVVGNSIHDIAVYVGINIEGQTPVGHPRNTLVAGNCVNRATTAGIDIIEAVGTRVVGNMVSDISGNHPGFLGYSFGIHLFGSPGTYVAGNDVRGVKGTRMVSGTSRGTGTGIDVAANSGGSEIIGNSAQGCSRAACSINDTQSTAATYDVLVAGNRFDSAVILEGNATLRTVDPVKAMKVQAQN